MQRIGFPADMKTTKRLKSRDCFLTCRRLKTPVLALRDAISFSSISSVRALESATEKNYNDIYKTKSEGNFSKKQPVRTCILLS